MGGLQAHQQQVPGIQLPPQQLFPPPQSFTGAAGPSQGTRQLGRYDTSLSRFSIGPVDESMRARVVIDPGNVALQPGAALPPGLYGGHVSPMTSAANLFPGGHGLPPPPPQPSATAPLSVLGGIVVPARGSELSGVRPSAADRLAAERDAVDQILRQISSTSDVRFLGSPTAEPPTGPTAPPLTTNRPGGNEGFTTYPVYGTETGRLFPALETHGKEDRRPASGRRLGPQGRFGGGTNEYREDLGQSTFGNRGINSRLQGEWDQIPGRQMMPNRRLNELAPNVRIENYPLPPYESIYSEAARTVQPMDNNLVRSDPLSNHNYHPHGNKQFFRTSTPPSPFDRIQSTTVVGVPFSPASEKGRPFINTGFNPPNTGDKFTVDDSLVRSFTADGRLPATSALQPGVVQPYHGPEELTRSRFRQQDEWMSEQSGHNAGRGRNRFVNMAVTNECSMC